METSKIERVRGSNDWCRYIRALQRIRQPWKATWSIWVPPVDVLVLEHTVLYLKKAAKTMRPTCTDFSSKRRLTLRPEITASVTCFSKPADAFACAALPTVGLRYEKTQSGRYRQFTQTDVE